MKQTLFTLALTTIFLTHQSFINPSVFNKKETVILNAGTPVSFKLIQNINSDDVEIGNTVLFSTDDVVVAGGQIVIRQGERSEGTVTDIRRKNDCSNCPDKFQRIEITIDRVKAIDGQYVRVFGPVFTARSKCPKCPVELNTTMRLDANVQSNTLITIQ